jgi:acetoin utilization deacetylase AcuC-like enzyme
VASRAAASRRSSPARVLAGNGTQACVEATSPGSARLPFSTAAAEGLLKVPTCKPWLGEGDASAVFFASVHGYGSGFYPGTGPTGDSGAAAPIGDAIEWVQDGVQPAAGARPAPGGPRVLNVGMAGTGPRAARGAAWRRVWAGRVLPALAQFAPDLLLISAGFDAHAKDSIQGPVNLGVTEADYEWLTEQLVAVANCSAHGRIVSVLEGGYRVQGGPASAFARSVQAHVRALALPSAERWDGPAEETALRAFWAQRAEANAAAQAEADAQLAAMQAAYAAAAAAEGLEQPPVASLLVREAEPAEEDGRRAKRARAPVNYSDLDRKMAEEEEQARAERARAVTVPPQ